MKKTSDNQAIIEQHFTEYASRLPATVEELKRTWQELCVNQWHEKDFSSFYTTVHNIAGMAAIYGFNETGQAAQDLEEILKDIEPANAPSEATEKEVENRLETLAHYANKPADSTAIPDLHQIGSLNSKDLIYIVDDDENARSYFELILKSAGYVIESFSDLEDFSRAMKKKMPDIIIMDIVFPEGKLAGVDAINQLGAELGKSIPVIFISARSDQDARIRALRAGGCAYITKPVKQETILSVVESNSRAEQNHRRILIIDDDPVAVSTYDVLMKKKHYDVETSSDPAETLNIIETFMPDLLVMDYHMPAYNGEELVKMLRQDKRYVNLPVIMVTADRDPDVKHRINQLPNTRLLIKPIESESFIESVAESIDDAYNSHRRVLDLLKYHPLGLSNLNYFYLELESAIAMSGGSELQHSLLYLAIDDPDAIRERMGLKRLVTLNKKIASHLLTLVEEDELVTQLTEFAYLVLIRAEKHVNLGARLDTIKDMVADKVFTVDDIDISVTPSIGVISITPKINSVDEAVNIAEKESVSAGRNGGNQICVGLVGSQGETEPESEIGHSFMEAFKGDGLRLQYQPIVNINTSEKIYEAYTRFVADEKRITPNQFMPFIKEYNLENEFNEKIITTLIQDISVRGNVADDKNRCAVIIKLEPTGAPMAQFLDWFEEYLEAGQIEIKHKLIFSFRESWVLANHDNFSAFMKKALELNFGIALEHVGMSKYSADLVKKIKPAFAKLAPAFVSRLLSEHPTSQLVLENLKTTDCNIVASSMENADAFAKLMAYDIEYFQGYLVQKPDDSLDFAFSQQNI